MNSGVDSGTWDCIIVGAGPAGLNGALVLGRARRRVVVHQALADLPPSEFEESELSAIPGQGPASPAYID